MPARIAIVGAGASGTLACIRLVQRFGDKAHVYLIERVPRQFHRGVAYSSTLSEQLLNVPAGRMGIDDEDPTDFLRWVRNGPLPGANADDFLPRSLYGDFLRDRYRALTERCRDQVTEVNAEVIGLDEDPECGLRILLDDGGLIQADHVVLAMGNAPPAHLPGMSASCIEHNGYVPWPWKTGALERVDGRDSVLFVGSGLTTVDLLLSLCDRGHHGPITILSRNGRLPLSHAWPGHYQLSAAPPVQSGVIGVLRWLRAEARVAQEAEVPWQQVIDAFKPQVQHVWLALSMPERERFLRHLRPYWEVHRHRMPIAVRNRIGRLMEEDRVTLMAGRITSMTTSGENLVVHVRPRTHAADAVLRVRHVINCSGPQADSRRMDQPLLKDLLAKGFASWDALHLGLNCDRQGALIHPSGQLSARISALGPLCKAALWECTAVPEIRVQAAALAERIFGLVSDRVQQ